MIPLCLFLLTVIIFTALSDLDKGIRSYIVMVTGIALAFILAVIGVNYHV